MTAPKDPKRRAEYLARERARNKRRRPKLAISAQPMPEGHRLKGVSFLTDRAGPAGGWDKTERDSDDPPAFEPVPPGFAVKSTASYLDGQGQVRAQWISADQAKIDQFEAFRAAVQELSEGARGVIAPVPWAMLPKPLDTDHTVVFPLGDPHIGMMTWAEETGANHDLKIAEADLFDTVDLLVHDAPRTHTAHLVNLGDFWHAENNAQRTPGHGHKLDVDGRSAKVARVGVRLVRRMIARLLEKYECVEWHSVPGNHDPEQSDVLSLVLETAYENEPRVIVHPGLNPYQYIEHGKTMLQISHGDGAKPEALPGIAATDMPELWGRTTHRYSLGGHVHHGQRKDYPGMSYESFCIMPPKDFWHHSKGYRARQCLHAIAYHKEFGERRRVTVDMAFLRANRAAR